MDVRLIRTICPYCGTGCSLLLAAADGRVRGVHPYPRSPVNAGKLCARGLSAAEFVNAPDRLTRPMIRKNGTLETVSWEEALTYTAKRLKTYLPSEIGILSSPRVSNEDNYVMMKFARGVLKTNNIDHCERLSHTSTVQPLIESFGYPAIDQQHCRHCRSGLYFRSRLKRVSSVSDHWAGNHHGTAERRTIHLRRPAKNIHRLDR